MFHFTIKDIENLTGIKAATLRIWEQRYALFALQTTLPKNHIYSNEAVKKILRIAFLYHQGIKIAAIAILDDEAIEQQIHAFSIELSNYSSYRLLLLIAAIDFDEPAFTKLLDDLCSVIGFEKSISEIAYPLLTKIQMLQHSNNKVSALEHFTRPIIHHKIIANTAIATNSRQPAIVLYTPDDERYELPLLFIHYLLKKYRWNTIYLGSNITIDILKQLPAVAPICYIYVHSTAPTAGPLADDYFGNLCGIFPDKKIVALGAAIGPMQRSFINVTVLDTDDAIYRFIRNNPYLGSTYFLHL